MAILAGIEMSECRLFKGKSGKVYFGTKRFDRVAGKRLHTHPLPALCTIFLERAQWMDYGHLMDCAFRMGKHVNAYEKGFQAGSIQYVFT